MISIVGGLHGAADVPRFDRQFAMAAVDQHQQLHDGRTAVIEQRIERRADRAAGVKHVVHQDDLFALHGKSISVPLSCGLMPTVLRSSR